MTHSSTSPPILQTLPICERDISAKLLITQLLPIISGPRSTEQLFILVSLPTTISPTLVSKKTFGSILTFFPAKTPFSICFFPFFSWGKDFSRFFLFEIIRFRNFLTFFIITHVFILRLPILPDFSACLCRSRANALCDKQGAGAGPRRQTASLSRKFPES